jgi:flagellar motor switch protein FliN/FliY
MTAVDTTQREALMRLGASTGEALAQVLEMFAPGAVERGEVSVVQEGTSPFAEITAGSVAASVSYVDGVSGANVFVLTADGVRKLTQAMGMPPPDGDSTELSELELSAVGEASNQMMSAAASAIGVVIGQEIEISPPDISVITDPAAAADQYGTSPYATSTTFLIAGETCRLIQLVPSAFMVRMARALDELSEQRLDDEPSADPYSEAQGTALEEALSEIKLRVWPELGRAHLPLSRALGLPLGSVVELNQDATAPVDLFVNGVRFATGRLIVTDDGEWAFQCDAVAGRSAVAAEAVAVRRAVAVAAGGSPEHLEAPAGAGTLDEADSPEEVVDAAVDAPEAPEEVVDAAVDAPEATEAVTDDPPEPPEELLDATVDAPDEADPAREADGAPVDAPNETEIDEPQAEVADDVTDAVVEPTGEDGTKTGAPDIPLPPAPSKSDPEEGALN